MEVGSIVHGIVNQIIILLLLIRYSNLNPLIHLLSPLVINIFIPLLPLNITTMPMLFRLS